jgi:mono/diheme cytochrome c family protein
MGTPVNAADAPLPSRHILSRAQILFLLLLPLALLLYVWLAARGVLGQAEYTRPAMVAAEVEPNGAALYIQHCARCHGERGNANGITSPSLDPPARRFGEEKFQLATTQNSIPADDDLLYVIRHGIPGTAMPAFDHLPEADARAIVSHVRWLAHAGTYSRLFRRAKKDEDEPDAEEISKQVVKLIQPGAQVELPKDLPEPTAESIARGKKTFGLNCATCHGPEGKGDGPNVKDMKNDLPEKGGNGRPTKPRDLARGVFKGGSETNRLYARLLLGMPGTPMPEMRALKPQEIGDMVNFVLSLSDQSRARSAAE